MSMGSNSPLGHGPQPGMGWHPALGPCHVSPCHRGSSLLTLALATHSRCLPPNCPDQALWQPPAQHRPLLPPPPASRPARRQLRAARATALSHLLRSPPPTSRSLLPPEPPQPAAFPGAALLHPTAWPQRSAGEGSARAMRRVRPHTAAPWVEMGSLVPPCPGRVLPEGAAPCPHTCSRDILAQAGGHSLYPALALRYG